MAAAAQLKIVIVEDEGLIAADLESRLKSAGYDVPGTADSAQPALQLIRETSPDLILMDIRLKGEQDGIHVAEVVREQLDIPVVYLSAYEDVATLERASRTQAYGYIKKPIVSASLKGSIEMAVAKHRYERGLREERDWVIASFGGVASAVIVTDANSRISYLNSQAEQLVGWSADKALRRPAATVLRLSHRQTGKPVEDLLTPVMLEGQTLPLPPGTLLQGSAERLYAIEGHVAPRWRDGRADGTVITFTDVTLCQFENDQVRQDHKQEALVRMADGIIRHLPQLDALTEASTHMLAALPPGSPLRETAETIKKAAMDASALGNHLRSYLQPPELECQRLRLDDVLKRLGESWKLIHVNFMLLMDPADPIHVQADEWQLLRALANVLLHARLHMRADSSLVVDLSSGEPEPLGKWVRIRARYVSAEEDAAALERVFEPAWSGSSEDLHVTYTLVKKMGGMVAALLEGNTVSLEIYLPRAVVTAADAAIEPECPAPLIEPNPFLRRAPSTRSKSTKSTGTSSSKPRAAKKAC